MAFTNVWDDAAPPDSQAASNGALDIRNLKVDTQERMAAISGADAAKQNFEAGFTGVLYFATDTGKIYRWGGAAWFDITADFYTGTTQQSYEGIGTVLDGTVRVSIPSSRLAANKRVTINAIVKAAVGGIPDAVNLYLNGGTYFLAISEVVAGNGYLWFQANIFLRATNLYDTMASVTYLTNAGGSAARGTMRYLAGLNAIDFSVNDMDIELVDAANTVVSEAILMVSVL